MPAVTRLAAALALAAAAPALAVGLGPLSKEGSVAGTRKAFYLTVLNPEAGVQIFTASAIGFDTETAENRVAVFPAQMRLGPGRMRQILVIAGDLQPGETYRFRVCAERAQDPEGSTIHARVCSKLTARRIGVALAPAAGAAGGH